jgi:hypothetical protein
MKVYLGHKVKHTEQTRNPVVAVENTPKPNFATVPKLYLDRLNSLED